MNITNLPPEIFSSILDLVDKKTLNNFRASCKIFKEMADLYKYDRIINRAISYPINKNDHIVDVFEKSKIFGDARVPSYKNLKIECEIHIYDLIKIIQQNPKLISIDVHQINFSDLSEVEENLNGQMFFLNDENFINEPVQYNLIEVYEAGDVIPLDEEDEEEENEFLLDQQNQKNLEELNELMTSLNNLKGLKQLNIRFNDELIVIPDFANSLVRSCPFIEELTLIKTQLDDKSLFQILKLPYLRRLEIRNSALTINNSIEYPICNRLNHLDLSDNTFLSSNIISLINSFPNLSTLILDNSADALFTDQMMKWVTVDDNVTHPDEKIGFQRLSMDNMITCLSAKNLNFVNIIDLLSIKQLKKVEILKASALPFFIKNNGIKILNRYERIKMIDTLKKFKYLKFLELKIDVNSVFNDFLILNRFPNIKSFSITADQKGIYMYMINNDEMNIISSLMHVKDLTISSRKFHSKYQIKQKNYTLEVLKLQNTSNYSFPFNKFINLKKVVLDIGEDLLTLKDLLRLRKLKNLNQLILNPKNGLIKFLTGSEIINFIDDIFTKSFFNYEEESNLCKRTLELNEHESKRQKLE